MEDVSTLDSYGFYRAYGVRVIYVSAELKHVRHVYLIDYIKAVPSMLALIFR